MEWLLLLALGILGIVAALTHAARANQRAREALDIARTTRQRLDVLERGIRRGEFLPRPPERPSAPSSAPTPARAEPRAVPVPAAPPAPAPLRSPWLPPLAPAEEPEAEETVAPTRKPAARPATSLEARIGGRWFNWIGILALILGVGYLVKYAHTQGWISPWAQVIGGLVLGLVVLGLLVLCAGVLSERRGYAVLARGFWGGGIAILYLALFAGRRIHGILPDGVAFLGMAGVTVIGAAIAIVSRSQVVAVLAAIGGYLTPVLLGGKPDQVFLFTYLAILTTGLLAIGFARRWRFLHPVAFVAMLAYFLGWWFVYAPGSWQWTVAFLAVFFVLFTAEPAISAGLRRSRPESWEITAAAISAVLAVLATHRLLGARAPGWTGVSFVLYALYHLAAALLTSRAGTRARELALWFGKAGLLLLVLFPGVEPTLAGWRMGAAWSALGVLFLVASLAFGRAAAAWGTGTLLLGAAHLLAVSTPRQLARPSPDWVPLWSERGFAFAIVTLAAGVGARLLSRAGGTARLERRAAGLLTVVCLGLPAVFLTFELRDALHTWAGLGWRDPAIRLWTSLLWAACATAVLTVVARRPAAWLQALALALLVVVWGKLVLHDLRPYRAAPHLLLHVRAVVLAGVALLVFVSHRRWSFAPLAASARPVLLTAAHLLVVLLLSLEWFDAAPRPGVGHAWWEARWVGLPALWSVYGLLLTVLGDRRATPLLTYLGASLFVVAMLVSLPFIAWPYAVPFLHVRAAAWVVLAASLFLASGRTKGLLGPAGWRAGAILAGHAAVVVLLTTEVSGLFRQGNVGRFLPTWLAAEHGRQLAFSLLWSTYALGLVIAGFRTRYRPIRLFALIFLAGTILKVFLVDLSFLDTPYRILSFIALGGILVGVSYLYQRFKERLIG